MTGQDWMDDPRLKAAAFSGSATNRHYSYVERLGMALKAVEILEGLVRQLDAELAKHQEPRVFSLTEIPADVTTVHDTTGVIWTREFGRWSPAIRNTAVDADGRMWHYADDRDLVVAFGPITEVIDT